MNTNTKKIGITAIAVFAIILFLTNPDQAMHLRAIKDTAALIDRPAADWTMFAVYNNYFLFSTVTNKVLGDQIMSWGALGKVSTTSNIKP